jgi:excisionase family DNA binding protein
MLTVAEFAEEFNVTKQTVYNWINAGRVNVVRIFINNLSTIRIKQSEVDRIKRGEINK